METTGPTYDQLDTLIERVNDLEDALESLDDIVDGITHLYQAIAGPMFLLSNMLVFFFVVLVLWICWKFLSGIFRGL